MPVDRLNPDGQTLKIAFGLHQKGQFGQAERLYREVIKAQPRNCDGHYLLGLLYAQQGRSESAAKYFGKAAQLKHDFLDAHYNQGVMLNALARHNAAISSYDKVLGLKPDHFESLRNRATSLFELGRFEEALAGYDRLLSLNQNYGDVHDSRGVVLRKLQRFEEAAASHDRSLSIDPNNAEAASNRAIALRALQRFDEALESYDRAITLKPDYAEAHFNRGIALTEMKRYAEAAQSYENAIRLKPDYAEAHSNLAIALLHLNRLDDALRHHDSAIKINPNYAEAYCSLAVVLTALKRFSEAIRSSDQAIRLRPNYAEAYNNRGVALNDLKRHEEALKNFDRAIEIRPDLADAHYNRGVVLNDLKRFDEAVTSYRRVAEIDSSYPYIEGTRLYATMRLCDWKNLEKEIAFIADRITAGEKASHPFPLLAAMDSSQLQKKAAENWVRDRVPAADTHPMRDLRPRGEKNRIGYFSTDFHDHATAYLTAGLFEEHDRSKFELVGFSLGPDQNDDTRNRLRSAFDEFIDLGAKSDTEVSQLAREREIDIAVDLNGFAQNSRTPIFAARAAPIQVNYLGYPGTMGAEYIDYLIADRIVIPPSDRSHYTEKLVFLPNSYQVNDRRRPVSDRTFNRAELGLPPEGFVFCCFNNNYKIMPDVFDIWTQILQQVDGSVLWLFEDNASAARNLRMAAADRNVNPERLIFARYMPLAEHLARHRAADLFLDTLPYNAHTTASDALWAGLPVLTRKGQTFPGRVAASLLTAVGLPELITDTVQEYEARAVELARDPAKLAPLGNKLARNRLTTPLFDTTLFTRQIEAAYMQMIDRQRAGLPPDDIHIEV